MDTNYTQSGSSSMGAVKEWITQTWLLVLWYLSLFRRRAIGLVLMIGLVACAEIVFAFLVIIFLVMRSFSPVGTTEQMLGTLTFPDSLRTVMGVVSFLGPIAFCILASVVVGNEYRYGMHRHMLARGISRWQVVCSQVTSLAIASLFITGIMILLGVLNGAIVGPALGSSFGEVSSSFWYGLPLYWLAYALRFFVYMMLAVFAATIGRSAIAGIGISLAYMLIELIIIATITITALALPNGSGQWIVYAINTLPGPATNVPIWLTEPLIFGNTLDVYQNLSGVFTWPYALIGLAVFLTIFIGGSYLVYNKRDMTD